VVETLTYITGTEMNILLKTFLVTNEFYKKWQMRTLTRHVGKECNAEYDTYQISK
jgi:hypothetical protein